jgi:hypothetical protein
VVLTPVTPFWVVSSQSIVINQHVQENLIKSMYTWYIILLAEEKKLVNTTECIFGCC